MSSYDKPRTYNFPSDLKDEKTKSPEFAAKMIIKKTRFEVLCLWRNHRVNKKMCSARNCQDDVEDDFWFETETLPLKGNKDYANLLRTLCLLEGQRTQALKDIDKLLEIQDEALEDPVAFASKLINNEDLGIPSPQIVPDLPEIDWSKYKVALPPEAFRPQTRNAGHRTQPENNDKPNVIKVRGRVYDNSKPITFNQLWTVEEQLRLEELLVKFPPEENETKRYMKIAEALGNRTVTQVSSRCQKYFLKLQKAGLPVPGRTPKIKSDYYKAPKYTSHQHSRNNAFLYPRSTFFPQLMPPVAMHEGEDLPGTVICQPGKSDVDCEEESVEDENFSEEVKNTDDFRKFMLLKRVKKDKEKPGDSSKTVHIGFRCNSCNEGPITGTRWHCTDCNDQDSIDFCSECIISQLESNKPHPLEHKIVPIRHQEYPAWDKDYSYQSYMGNSSNYNYLDPTFMPQ